MERVKIFTGSIKPGFRGFSSPLEREMNRWMEEMEVRTKGFSITGVAQVVNRSKAVISVWYQVNE